MILDRTWNKRDRKLTISYINKLGKREFYTKYLGYMKTYEYDDEGDILTWNDRKCKEVYKDTSTYKPNEFDILEYLYELPEDMKKRFYAQNFPKIYTFDIETEYSNEFPYPEEAKYKVTAISLVGPDMSCIVYGLNDMDETKSNLFKERYLQWIQDNDFARNLCKVNGWKPKVLYQKFDTEEEMLKHWFTVIVPKIPVLCGWNSWRFDWMYLTNRITRLFGKGEAYHMIRKSSPTGEIKNISWQDQDKTRHSIPGPVHTEILDYMEIVKKYDYILRPYESYSLNWVSEHAVNAHKIEYDGDLQDLYERDHAWYYFYNAIDSLLVLLIHYKLKPLESPCAVSSVTLVSLPDSFGQVALTTANVFREFYDEGKRVVYDYDAIVREKKEYKGAFTGCNAGKYSWNCCFDFASLYPRQIQTCNLSMENFVEKRIGPDSYGRYTVVPWSDEELENFKKDKNYFVTVMGHVYKNDKDYCFKKVQCTIAQKRDNYKYTGQRIESELITEIDKRLAELKNTA